MFSKKNEVVHVCTKGFEQFDSVIRRYISVIKAAPSANEIEIHIFETEEQAIKKGLRLRKWPYIAFARARDEKGRFTKNWALILCR